MATSDASVAKRNPVASGTGRRITGGEHKAFLNLRKLIS